MKSGSPLTEDPGYSRLTTPRPKTLIFDLMGTCLDWHQNIYNALNNTLTLTTEARGISHPTTYEVSQLALAWRQGFFDEIHARFQAAKPAEDIDDTHRRVLKQLIGEKRWHRFSTLSDEHIEQCVQAWHKQVAWPDVIAAMPKLKEAYDVVVLANGTTRLQIDITKSSGLAFDMLLSSELLGITKPDLAIYRKAMVLLKRKPEDCVMVAAHAYDLRAAKAVGMRTVYLQRWTEDPKENMEVVRAENDWLVDARQATKEAGGMMEVCRFLEQA